MAREDGADEAVIVAVVGAYYSEAVRAGTAARLRAQAGQSVASVVAAGLVASLTVTELNEQDSLVAWGGVVAVILWVVAALLYMRAVGAAYVPDDEVTAVSDPSDLVHVVLKRAKDERDAVDARQKHAARVAGAALIGTVLTFGAIVVLPNEGPSPASVYLEGASATVIERDCGRTSPFRGTVEDAKAGANRALVFQVSAGKCRGQERTYLVPREDVGVIDLHD